MLAADLQVSLPLVNRLTPAVVAARLVARWHASGLVVADDAGTPVAVLSAPDVLTLLLPDSLTNEPSVLAGPDDSRADAASTGGSSRRIGELLDMPGRDLREIPFVESSATLTELAMAMLAANAEIAVVDGASRGPWFVTLPVVMSAILAERGDDEDPR